MAIEQFRLQLQALSEWKHAQERTLKKVIRSLTVGVVLITIGFAGGVWRVQNLTEDNKRTIATVERLNHDNAQQAYTECLTRNKTTVSNQVTLRKLVEAHTKDKDENAAAFWNSYLAILRQQVPPFCEKPPK